MLRATISKVKRACALARIPRILRGDFQLPPCNFDKISAIFMKSKSTTSGSKDDEDEKCKKCKRLIELAFGPEMPPPEDGIEKIEIAKIPELHAENVTQITTDITRPETICEKDNRVATGVTMSKEEDNDEDMPNILKATKVDDEDTFKQKEIINEPPFFQSLTNKETHVGRPTPVLLSNKDSKTQLSGDKNMLEMIAKESSDIIDNKVLNEIEKLGISQQLLKDITNDSLDEGISTDKSKKDPRKPGKISEIDLETRVLEKDQTKMSERNFINRRAIKHLAMHMGAEDISKNITSSENKSSEAKMKKGDEDSTNKLTYDKHLRIDQEIPIEREKLPDIEKEQVKLNHVITPKILIDDKRIWTEHKVPLDSRIRPQHDTLFDSEKLPEIKREKDELDNKSSNILTYDRQIRRDQTLIDREVSGINREKNSNIFTDDRHFRTEIKSSPLDRETLPEIAREKVKLGNVKIQTYKEPVLETADDNDNKEPAVLVKKCQDPDCFRINPETPKAYTLRDQLMALNLKNKEAIAAVPTSETEEFKKEEDIPPKEIERQKLTKQMEKMFKDDRMPQHLFAHLTVVSKEASGKSGASKVAEPSAFNQAKTEKMVKDQRVPPHMFNDLTVLSRNLPKELELKKAIQNFYHKEHDPELVKPDRLQYNSPKDNIVEERDYALELDPRVVIKEFEIQQPMEPFHPQNPQNPQGPYYSNYFNDQGNMFPHNMRSQNMPAQNPYHMPSQNPYHMPSQNPYHMPSQNPYHMPSQNPYNTPPPFGGPQNMQMASADMFLNVRPNEMPHNIANRTPSSYSEKPPEEKIAEDFYNETQTKEIPRDNINLPHIKKPLAASTFTSLEGTLTDNIISTGNINATHTVTHNHTAFHDNPNMTSSIDNSNQAHTGPYLITPPVKLKANTIDFPNRVIERKESIMDKKYESIKENLKRSIMPGLTPETARFRVRSGFVETPIKIKNDWRKSKDSHAKAKRPAKPYGFQSKATVSPWLDKGTVNLHPSIATQGPENFPLPTLHPNMALSEMLKNVRQRARLEMYQQLFFTLSGPARKVKPTRGSCKKPKPPCPPPQKTCPSSKPSKCPPPTCPKPPPPPKPCKPACPDPCATPKCPPPAKKDPCPCAKCKKTERGSDVLGLIVTLGSMNMSKLSAVSYRPSDELPEDVISNSLFMEETFQCGSLPDSISLSDFEDPLMEAVYDVEDNIIIPDLLHKSFIFPKDFEPWTPIPSWPIPRKEKKRRLVCPKEGCKVRGPPPPGASCETIHHPCAGFPNDKKRT